MLLPSQQVLNELLTYDATSGHLHWRPRPRELFATQRAFNTWNTRYAGQRAFTAPDRKGYHIGAIFDVNYRASRVIYKMVYGIDADQVDHEDGNNQNDRLSNFRDVTGQQNQRNMKRPSNNTSGIIGVSWNTAKNKWDAKIKIDGKTINLGRFADKNDAAAARKTAEAAYGFHPNHGR